MTRIRSISIINRLATSSSINRNNNSNNIIHSITVRSLSTAASRTNNRLFPSNTSNNNSKFYSLYNSNLLSKSNNLLLTRGFAGNSGNSNSILIYAEHNNSKLHPTTLNAVTAAKKINPKADITIFIAGHNASSVAKQASNISGIKSVVLADDPAYAHQLSENTSAALVDYHKTNGFQYLLAPASAISRSILPRVAVLLDVQPITDIIEVNSADTFIRPIYAGNALATVQSTDKTIIITVRSTAFPPAGIDSSTSAPITQYKPSSATETNKSKWLTESLSVSSRPELGAAKVVVSGGRGLKSGDNFKLLESLADELGGAVGASRAAVDAGYVPNDYQVGQTGKVVAPQLYIAVGISGAIQHLAGMKDSKTIVAINKDSEAPIFQIADYGLVADLFKAVPELTEKIKASKK